MNIKNIAKEEDKIDKNVALYQHLSKQNFDDYNLLKVEILKKHLEE